MGKIIPLQGKKQGKSLSILSMLITVTIFISVFLLSPVFAIEKIEIQGNKRYSKEEIYDQLHVKEGMNFFRFMMNHPKKFKEDPYIEQIQVQWDFPKKVQIQILERKTIGYVPYMGAYLYIDKDGRVLETSNDFDTPLPLLEGLNFQGFCLGEPLEVEQEEIFDAILKISQTMFKYELLDEIVKIDVNNPQDIQLQMGNIHVLLGSIQEYDYKIRALLQILEHLPKEEKGFLDLKDTSKPFVFKYLT